MRDDRVYLQHILDAIENIQSFLKNIDNEKFLKNILVNSAVTRQLEIIGEAVKNLPSDFKRMYPEVRWRDIGRLTQ